MEHSSLHIPVLMKEAVEGLNLRAQKVYVDGTFGRGGYSRYILKNYPDSILIAMDRDPDSLDAASGLKEEFGDRFNFVQDCFSTMKSHLLRLGHEKIAGVVLDLGVSSLQLDKGSRGFSFQQDAPLDMRMSQQGKTAEEVVNTLSEKELADIIYAYGEERYSRHIAAEIVKQRQEKNIQTTFELAEIVRSKVRKSYTSKIDAATRTFQAIRIYVNDELGEIERLLADIPDILEKEGRLSVVAFHSLEDSLVKQTCRKWCENISYISRHLPDINEHEPQFKYLRKKVIKPSEEEIKSNPRARSARLRIIERC